MRSLERAPGASGSTGPAANTAGTIALVQTTDDGRRSTSRSTCPALPCLEPKWYPEREPCSSPGQAHTDKSQILCVCSRLALLTRVSTSSSWLPFSCACPFFFPAPLQPPLPQPPPLDVAQPPPPARASRHHICHCGNWPPRRSTLQRLRPRLTGRNRSRLHALQPPLSPSRKFKADLRQVPFATSPTMASHPPPPDASTSAAPSTSMSAPSAATQSVGGPSTQAPVKRNRRSNPKVKTGCANCKYAIHRGPLHMLPLPR